MATEIKRTPIRGVLEIIGKPFTDSRGEFINAYRAEEPAFRQTWGSQRVAQVNISRNDIVGTVRGLHLQAGPHSEAKLVRCLHGLIWDVVVDLRPDSETYATWHAVVLRPAAYNALFIPKGCAHGFQVLEARSELLYLHSGSWIPEAETGVRFDDTNLSISWPLKPTGLSVRDLSLPTLEL